MGQLLIGVINGVLLCAAQPRPRGHLRPAAASSTSPTARSTCSAPSSAFLLLAIVGIGYWPALILAPLIVGAARRVVERRR